MHSLRELALCVSLVYFDFSHLWLPTAAPATHTCVHAQAHDTQSLVINSITHTPVNANEAKTNPFLLMVCLHLALSCSHKKGSKKKSFSFLFFFSSLSLSVVSPSHVAISAFAQLSLQELPLAVALSFPAFRPYEKVLSGVFPRQN